MRRIPAGGFGAQHGVQTAPCSEGGRCIGWIEDGDWVRYDGVDFGDGTNAVAIRTASATAGGIIELRLGGPEGKILGACDAANTGDWQKWTTSFVPVEDVSGVQSVCLVFRARAANRESTTIWAQFPGVGPNEAGVDPNEAGVEINVRQSVFYPDEPGRNYITVRGFTLEHAATPWAPPTAEQIGLIGTHWSKGWIIENNTIRYSTCVGVALGKHGDEWDNTSQNTAEGYVKTIERGLARGWSKANIGRHVVRNNHISHCEQAGIVGSLGPVFCTIAGNLIHDIHVRQLFSGAEMAGIKLHAAVDTVISGNRIFRANRGIWLDWMAQGTRVTRNLLYGNGPSEDLFVEVNHGPFLVDHNVMLSATSLLDMSEGGAYAHNLMAGRIVRHPEMRRLTPFLEAHGTAVAGLAPTRGGDDRFINNIFAGGGASLAAYDDADLPVLMSGNVFLGGESPSKHGQAPIAARDFDPAIELVETPGSVLLALTVDSAWASLRQRDLVTSALLGNASVPDLPFEQPDGSPYSLDTDYAGKARHAENPFPGPFELPDGGRHRIKVWPLGGE